jgi:glycosyltransferase involved in cell wall biosynthesis
MEIRILNVIFDERFTGPASRILQVARGLRPLGFETVVAMPDGDKTFGSLLSESGFAYHSLPLVRLRDTVNPAVHARYLAAFGANVRALRRIIRQERIGIIHTNGLMNIQVVLAARLEKIPVLWHLNEPDVPLPLRILYRGLLKRMAAVVAVAAKERAGYYRLRPDAFGSRLRVLYAPVDTVRFNPKVSGDPVRTEFGIEPGCPVIGAVAAFSPNKGFRHLIEAFPAIKRQYSRAKLMLVGELLSNRRHYWQPLMDRAQELGYRSDVFFTGQRLDIPRVMRAFDVFVHPSESEACPMAVLEACASGVPVVATDVGGTREIVLDGITGVVVEPRKPAQIGDAVLRMLGSAEAAREMARCGAERVNEIFSLEKCVMTHAALYRKALEASPCHARAATELPDGREDAVEDSATMSQLS